MVTVPMIIAGPALVCHKVLHATLNLLVKVAVIFVNSNLQCHR